MVGLRLGLIWLFVGVSTAHAGAVLECDRFVKGRTVEKIRIEREKADVRIKHQALNLINLDRLEDRSSKVLFQSLTFENGEKGTPVSVIVVDNSIYSQLHKKLLTFSPITYYVNWGSGVVSSVYLDYQGKTNILTDWNCVRLD